MSNTLELVVQELQNRIGQITTQYETQMAILKVQAHEAMQEKDEKIKKLTDTIESNKKEK
jgi:riboflavin synthase